MGKLRKEIERLEEVFREKAHGAYRDSDNHTHELLQVACDLEGDACLLAAENLKVALTSTNKNKSLFNATDLGGLPIPFADEKEFKLDATTTVSEALKVGDEVTWNSGTEGIKQNKIKEIDYIIYDECGWRRKFRADELTKVKDPLPDDHVDRYWIPGAHLISKWGDGIGFLVVIDEKFGVDVWTNSEFTKFFLYADIEEEQKVGWSFHSSSPIQEKK